MKNTHILVDCIEKLMEKSVQKVKCIKMKILFQIYKYKVMFLNNKYSKNIMNILPNNIPKFLGFVNIYKVDIFNFLLFIFFVFSSYFIIFL